MPDQGTGRELGNAGCICGRNCFNTALACSIVVAPASRSSVISRSWKVPAARSTRPLAWGDKGEYHLDTQFCHGPSELGRRSGRLGSGRVLEDRVAVGIEGEGDAAAPEQVLHQQEVVVAVFLLAKQGVDHGAGGVVHRQQQRERWAVQSPNHR